MTTDDIHQQLIQIAREAHTDQEAATNRERRLIRDVLMAIGEEAGHAGGLARAALAVFERDRS